MQDDQSVLEVASGSGQHALYFTEQNPKLRWFCSELSGVRDALQLNLNALASISFPEIQTLDLLDPSSSDRVIDHGPYDRIYTANSLHIISWDACLALFQLASKALESGGLLCMYGPFIFEQGKTAPSNLEFDAWLKARDPVSGVRLFSKVCDELNSLDFELMTQNEMPANNHLMVFRKR